MYCQKCRTPLKLHGSLDNLNSAAFHLLADAPSTSDTPPAQDVSSIESSQYSAAQKSLYDQASKQSQNPIFKQSVPSSQHHASSTTNTPPSLQRDHTNTMSFVNITDSQVVPASVAQKASPQTPQRRQAQTRSPRKSSSRRTSRDSTRSQDALLPNKIEMSTRLFEILSSRSDIDHPICNECTDMLIEGMERRLADATRERDAYISFLKNLQANVPTDDEVQQTRTELEETRKEEKAAMKQLESLESQKAALSREISALDLEQVQLNKEEENFWRERNAFAQTLSDYQNERDSINLRFDHDSRLLERLQRTNVYNDTFNISHDGYFATINGLRLGRMSGVTVEWAEINAAWGQACLLLDTVAEKLGFRFRGYRLNPLGSTSTIDKIETSKSANSSPLQSQHGEGSGSNSLKGSTTTLSLFYTSDLPLSLAFLHRNFDSAMIAFLECIRQLGEFVERATSPTTPHHQTSSPSKHHTPFTKSPKKDNRNKPAEGLRLPYTIQKDRIHDCSIKLGGGGSVGFGGKGAAGDESWSKACKYTLTNCKFLLAHLSNLEGARTEGAEGG